VELVCDTTKFTKGELIKKVLKGKLSVNEPSVYFNGTLLHETGDDLDEDEVEMYASFETRALNALPGGGVVNGSILSVEDFSQDFKFELMVTHREEWDEEKEPDGFLLRGEEVKAREEDAGDEANATEESPVADDGLVIVDDDIEVVPSAARKRTRDEGEGDDGHKAAKLS
jgi:ubiquitin-like 1-activating enzyme E1 B